MHSLYKSGFPAIQLNDESFMLLKDQEVILIIIFIPN
jgi:hypothetical protein